MKILHVFDSLKFVLATVACVFAIMPAHAATLPAGYTELEYLESTVAPTQAYINTGLNFNSDYMYEITYAKGGKANIIMGVRKDTNYSAVGNFAVTYCTDTCVYSSTETGSTSAKFNDATFGVKHTVKYQQSTSTLLFDNTDKWEANWLTQTSIPYNMYLFAFNSVGTAGGSRTGYVRIYSYSVKNANGAFVQNFIPARRDSDGVLGMYDLADPNPATAFHTNAGTGTFIAGEWQIKIATTKYNEQQFAPVETDLDAAVAAVDTVVTQTMSQAQAIDTIATTKQTRPDESCPRFKKCLLVEDEDGTPHWYEIYDPINDFLRPILAAAGLSGNQGAPLVRTHACTGTGGEPASGTCYDEFNGFYMGSNVFRQKYYGLDTTYNRPFGPTTLARCAENAPRTTSTKEAGICYNTGGMFRELTNDSDNYVGEWALVWNGNEGGNSLGITPGVVYGVAKCTSVGQHTTEITGDVQSGSGYWWPKKLNNYSTTLASLITEYPNSNVETVFNTLPNPLTDDDNPEYPRNNFINCWCKMTAIGVPGAGDDFAEQTANGSIMGVSGDWIFNHVRTSATDCANTCTYYCAYYFSVIASYRRTVLTVK